MIWLVSLAFILSLMWNSLAEFLALEEVERLLNGMELPQRSERVAAIIRGLIRQVHDRKEAEHKAYKGGKP